MARPLWLVFLPVACAAGRAERPAVAPEPPLHDRSLDAAIVQAVSRERPPEAEARRLSQLGARWRPKTIGEPPFQERPLGRRAFVDVRFADAELEEALRLLAEAGGFALVADGELAGRVTARLRHVRPYEALVSLAEAHGARVERRGVIVVVTPR